MNLNPRALAGRLLGPHSFEEAHVALGLIRGVPPVMVDVGAHHGGSLLPFASRGWEVHAFEPDPANRLVLERVVAELPRVAVSGEAISSVDDEEVPLYTSEVSTGISSLSPFHASHRPTAMAVTRRLDTYLGGHGVGSVGFLKVDAEGHDLTVMRTFPWDSIHPSVVLCEFEDRKTIPLGHCMTDTAQFLVSLGYAVIVSEWYPIVEYGEGHQWRRAAQFPVDVADDAWGNLLAVPPAKVSSAMRLFRLSAVRLRLRHLAERIA